MRLRDLTCHGTEYGVRPDFTWMSGPKVPSTRFWTSSARLRSSAAGHGPRVEGNPAELSFGANIPGALGYSIAGD
jgi:hypothetical protein